MVTNPYLKALSGTASFWWNDTAAYETMDQAIENGATGVTTNPVLVKKSLYANPGFWRPYLEDMDKSLKGDAKIEEIIRRVTVQIAKKFEPVWKASGKKQGYVCAQVNPKKQGDRQAMLEMGKRLAAWAPNIAVKFPATAAGLDAAEELGALGITTVGTVSFTTPQAVEIARRQQAGIDRARASGLEPGRAFSVIMVGRLDDYIRDVAMDGGFSLSEDDIHCAGVACIKRAYRICRERGYEAQLMPAAFRGGYHLPMLAGFDMSMSVAENIQGMVKDLEFRENAEPEAPKESLDRLLKVPEFRRAYEPDGLRPEEFISYGVTQRTLSQFVEAGWNPIGEFPL